jgi:dihydroorotate dehydrogenase electron transfer subunit
MKETGSVKKGVFDARICANAQIGKRFWRLRLELNGDGTKSFATALPGQFAQLDVSNLPLPDKENIPEELRDSAGRSILLRRPFSLSDVTSGKTKTEVEILYCVRGPGTLRMTGLREEGRVSIIGPLGRGFSVPQGRQTALLVAGGMGIAPLEYLRKFLSQNHPKMKIVVFVGARTAQELPCKPQDCTGDSEEGLKAILATDDGSVGFKGPITLCLEEWLQKTALTGSQCVMYACGPEAMLAKVAEIARIQDMDCQVSLERMMACGIGVCQSCAVECIVPGSKETVYKLCCEDGPVFDSKDVVWTIRDE